MALNINQIATAASSILSTDKLYLGRSPFGATDDRYILGSTIIAQFSPAKLTNVTGATQAIAVNTGYIANNAAGVAFTLPATAAVGDRFAIQGSEAGGWSIAQNANQILHVGSSPSTTGVLGSVASSNRYDSVVFVCIVANLEFATLGGPQGNLTVA